MYLNSMSNPAFEWSRQQYINADSGPGSESEPPAAPSDDDYTPPHFRDANYRNRLSWGLTCMLLILCA